MSRLLIIRLPSTIETKLHELPPLLKDHQCPQQTIITLSTVSLHVFVVTTSSHGPIQNVLPASITHPVLALQVSTHTVRLVVAPRSPAVTNTLNLPPGMNKCPIHTTLWHAVSEATIPSTLFHPPTISQTTSLDPSPGMNNSTYTLIISHPCLRLSPTTLLHLLRVLLILALLALALLDPPQPPLTCTKMLILPALFNMRWPKNHPSLQAQSTRSPVFRNDDPL